MTNHTTITVLLLLLLTACEVDQAGLPCQEFQIPVIVNSQFNAVIPHDTLVAEYISGVYPSFAGKYSFGERVDVNPELRYEPHREAEIYKLYESRLKDSLDVTGFEMVVDYPTTVFYNDHYELDSAQYAHYPVYFINSSQTDKVFPGKDSHVHGIQEARNANEWGQWRPIEHRGFEFCGNGKWEVIVHPNEFVVVLMRKYKGDIKTQLRARFALGENRYVSTPFEGSIRSQQFAMKDSSFVKRNMQESNGADASWLFLGASPDRSQWEGE